MTIVWKKKNEQFCIQPSHTVVKICLFNLQGFFASVDICQRKIFAPQIKLGNLLLQRRAHQPKLSSLLTHDFYRWKLAFGLVSCSGRPKKPAWWYTVRNHDHLTGVSLLLGVVINTVGRPLSSMLILQWYHVSMTDGGQLSKLTGTALRRIGNAGTVH